MERGAISSFNFMERGTLRNTGVFFDLPKIMLKKGWEEWWRNVSVLVSIWYLLLFEKRVKGLDSQRFQLTTWNTSLKIKLCVVNLDNMIPPMRAACQQKSKGQLQHANLHFQNWTSRRGNTFLNLETANGWKGLLWSGGTPKGKQV